jgi:hypothetical protein
MKKSVFVSIVTILFVALFLLPMNHSAFINMQKATLGSKEVMLEIDPIGCGILARNSYEINCVKQKPPISVNNIHILWRGNDYYLEFQGKDKKTHDVIIPASHIFGLFLNKI